MTSPDLDPAEADLLERYRQASSAESLAPTDAVRAAILAEGRRVARENAATGPLESLDVSQPAANQSRWKIAAFGTFGVAILAVLLIVPRWIVPESPPRTAVSVPVRAVGQLREVAPAGAEARAQAGAPATTTESVIVSAQRRSSARDSKAQLPQAARAYAPFAAPAAADRSAASPASLLTAVAARDLGRVTYLLDHHASLEAHDESGRTPLMLATVSGQVEIVRLLLAHGADPNAVDQQGATPLQQARRSQLTEIAGLLEQAGAH